MISPHLVIIPREEQELRLSRIRKAMADASISRALVSANSNLYYLTGRVFSGYAMIFADGRPTLYFVKRPVGLTGEGVHPIRKPENILPLLAELGIDTQEPTALELNALTYNSALRLAAALGTPSPADVSATLATARSRKTPYEVKQIRISGVKQAAVYSHIPHMYHSGMSDIDLQIEIEHRLRLEGCLGQFRISGDDMEIHMGSILAGDNADAPSPYDFAMGGAGVDPSLPGGADGTIIHPGMAVMVDMNGNFTGYMTDMTRTFYAGSLPQRAIDAHRLSIDICAELAAMGTPGTEAKALYAKAEAMAKDAGLEEYFMGHRQHAGFVGHGVGIEVNELPVLAPRSKNILAEGNVIAIEPKFVLPSVGAVGIENTYLVKESGAMECLTISPQQLIKLD